MSLIHLSTELRQELKLTPQLLQSMELLQMNSQELLDYLNQVSEENPLVEQTDLASLHKAYEALRQKVHWINGGLPEDGHGAMPDRGAADRETESLSAFLCDQLERRRLPKPLLALTRYLAELVDEEGRLSQEDLDGVADLKIPQPLIQQALETLQSLDPAGVGARSLSECLLLQLARQDAPSPLDMEIVRRFLPDLGKKHYSLIARELHTTLEEVRAAEKRISALDPCPGRSFQPAEPTLYVRPDLFIAELDGKLQVILNDYYLPRVSISQYYVRLLKESDEPETQAYLQQKMQQAKWLLNSLERRGSTLRQCVEAILEVQQAFFAGQTTELAPMTMVTLAERLHLHPSTGSRATREKYLQCRQGTYPLRYFFSRALGEQGPSQQTVKLRLLELIRQEDHSRPLSDQKLAELLAEQGIRIARRTVAKYRTELRLGSAAARKRDCALMRPQRPAVYNRTPRPEFRPGLPCFCGLQGPQDLFITRHRIRRAGPGYRQGAGRRGQGQRLFQRGALQRPAQEVAGEGVSRRGGVHHRRLPGRDPGPLGPPRRSSALFSQGQHHGGLRIPRRQRVQNGLRRLCSRQEGALHLVHQQPGQRLQRQALQLLIGRSCVHGRPHPPAGRLADDLLHAAGLILQQHRVPG